MSSKSNVSASALIDQMRVSARYQGDERLKLVNKVLDKNLLINSDISAIVAEAEIENLRTELNSRNELKEVFVYQKVKKDEEAELRKDFWMFNLNFTKANDASGHPYYRAHRLLSKIKLLKMAKIGKYAQPKHGYDCVYKDVGGNPITHLNAGENHVHTCAPILSNNDDRRRSAFLEQLRRRVPKSFEKKLYEKFIRGDSSVICNRKSQNCNIKSEVLMFLHSSYDISKEDIAMSMYRAGALTAYGCFHFHPDVMFKNEGELSHGLFFRKLIRDGRVRIRFWFKNDCQEGYEHDWITYISLIRTNRISAVVDGKTSYYNVQFDTIQSNTIYFVIRKCISGMIPQSSPFRVFTNDSMDDKMVIYHWNWDTLNPGTFLTKVEDHMKPIRICPPKKLYSRMFSYGSSLTDTRFTVKNIELAGISFNSREIVSGQPVSVSPMEPWEIKILANIVWMQIYIANYETTKTMSLLLKQETEVRKLSECGLFKRFFSNRCFAALNALRPDLQFQVMSDDTVDNQTSVLKSFFEYVRNNSAVERRFETLIETKFCQFVTIEEELDALLIDEELHDRGFSDENPLVSFIDPKVVKEVIEAGLVVEESIRPCVSKTDLDECVCVSDLKVVENVSNGHCVFQSIIDVGLFSGSVFELRQLMSASDALKQMVRRVELKKILDTVDGSPEGYGTIEIYQMIAIMFQVRICVHLGDCSNSKRFGEGDLYHFEIVGDHANALVPFVEFDDTPTLDLKGDYNETRQFLQLRDQLKSTSKNKFIKYYKAALELSYPLSKLENGGYVSNDGMNVAEIMMRYDMDPTTAFVSGGPGGAVQRLTSLGVTVVGSADSKVSPFSIAVSHECFRNVYGSKLNGDIDDPTSVAEEALRFRMQGYDFFFGCRTRISSRLQIDESEFEKEVELMKLVLKPGGDAAFRVTLASDMKVYSSLTKMFSNVELIRLDTINPILPGFFVVCMNYQDSVGHDVDVAHIKNFMNDTLCQSFDRFYGVFVALHRGEEIPHVFEKEKLEGYKNALTNKISQSAGMKAMQVVAEIHSKTVVKTKEWLMKRKNLANGYSRVEDEEFIELVTLNSEDVVEGSSEDVSDDSETTCDSREVHCEEGEEVRENLVTVPGKKRKLRLRKKVKNLVNKLVDVVKKKPECDEDVTEQFTELGQERPTGITVCEFEVVELKADASDFIDDHDSSANDDEVKCGNTGEIQKSVVRPSDVIDEFFELTKFELEVEISNHGRVINKLRNLLPLKSVIQAEVGGYGLCEYLGDSNWRYIVKPAIVLKNYNKFFHDGRFLSFEEIDDHLEVGDEFLISDYCELALHSDMLNVMKNFDYKNFVLPKIGIVQAAPGCGKTTFIVNNCSTPDKEKPSTVLLSTTEGRDDFQKRIEKRINCELTKDQIRYVRTLMSYCLNPSKNPSCDELFVDEALMAHPGQIFFAVYLSGAKVVKCLGDVLQIPFVNRTPDFKVKFAKLSELVDIDEVLGVSYRCPADVACRLNPAYVAENKKNGHDIGMKSAKKSLENTCVVHRISSEKFPIEKDVQYLTFTQSEKQKVALKGVKVSTVHEYQGKEARRIIVVRLDDKKQSEIYLRFNYALVALTRHTERLDYYTRCDTDCLSKLINVDGISRHAANTDDEIKECVDFKAGVYDGTNVITQIVVPKIENEFRSMKIVNSRISAVVGDRLFFTSVSYEKLPVSRPAVVHDFCFVANKTGRDFFVAVRQNSTDDMSLKLMRKNLDLMKKAVKVEKMYVDDSFEKYFARTSVSYLLSKICKNVVLCTTSQKRDIPSEVFEYTAVNGICEIGAPELQVANLVEKPLSDVVGTSVPFEPHLIQEMLDDVFGETNYLSQKYDAWMVNTSDFEINIGEVSYDPNSKVVLPERVVGVEPKLHTTLPNLREYTVRENLLALEKRNRNVPHISGTVDVARTAKCMVDKLFDRCFDEDRLENCRITVSADSIAEWLEKQPLVVLPKIVPEFALHQEAVNQYNFSIKRRAKPNLTIDAYDSYSALQTIVYHEKSINAAFCSVFSQIKKKVFSILKKHVFLFSDMSSTEFEDRLNNVVKSTDLIDELEIDISKYDKSQGCVALEFECELMRRFGVDEYYVDLWYKAHVLTTLYDKSTKLQTHVSYQRKSGDASTFIGNTLFLMAVIADLVPVDELDLAMFSGDDSLLFGTGLAKYKDPVHFGLKFNLEIKFFQFDYWYFCSKFLVKDGDKFKLVPDPLKMFVKLGRNDIVDAVHLEEYRVSLQDNCVAYKNLEVCFEVAKAVSERYNVEDYSSLFRMIPEILKKENFSKLFDVKVECSSNIRFDFYKD